MKKSFLCLACLFLLGGCAGDKQQRTEETANNLTYRESTLMIHPSQVNEHFSLLEMDGEYFYYSVDEVTETEKEETYEETRYFYRHALTKENASEELILSLSSPIFRDLCINGEQAYFLLGRASEDGIYHVLQEYDMKGNLMSELSLKDSLQERPDKIMCLADGCFGILTPGYFVIIDKQGEKKLSVTCPGEEFRGMVELPDGQIGLTYQEKGNQIVSFVRLNRKNKAFSTAVSISGEGRLLLAQPEGLFYTDSTGLKLLSDRDNTTETVVSFAGRNISNEQLVCIQGEPSEYSILGYSSDRSCAKYIRYTLQEQTTDIAKADSGRYDDYGRRYLYLYDVSGELPQDMTNPVDAFNEQSDDYQVVVRDYHFDPENSDTYDAAKIMASGDYPDLIFSTYNSLIETLLCKNCLEDLTPYLEHSENLSMEELSPVVTNAYTKQGILFALPDFFTIEAIYGEKEYLGEGGWTVPEFLDWLAQNPDAGGMIAMRKQIYDACIDSILEEYIDWDNKIVSLDGEDFQNILIQIQKLNRKDSYSYKEAMALYENQRSNLYIHISSPGHIATFENHRSIEATIKGYPCNSGEPVAYLSSPAMSILANSEVKEGAYEFLEFYLTYVGELFGHQTKEMGFSKFYTVNRYLEQALQDLLLADNSAGTPCTFSQEQLNKALDILPYVRLRDYSRDDLKEIIWEEMVLYLDGQRNLDSTCKVIQSRVQLYVNER